MLKFDDFRKANKILILGDAGSGKSTLAARLAAALNLPLFQTDDALYVKKFSIHRDRQEAIKLMEDIYAKEQWIVEGTTRDLLKPGVEKADLIIYIYFESIFNQYRQLYHRHLDHKHETLINLLGLMAHVTNKRFRLTPKMRKETLLEMAQKNPNLIIEKFPIEFGAS